MEPQLLQHNRPAPLELRLNKLYKTRRGQPAAQPRALRGGSSSTKGRVGLDVVSTPQKGPGGSRLAQRHWAPLWLAEAKHRPRAMPGRLPFRSVRGQRGLPPHGPGPRREAPLLPKPTPPPPPHTQPGPRPSPPREAPPAAAAASLRAPRLMQLKAQAKPMQNLVGEKKGVCFGYSYRQLFPSCPTK